MDAARRGAAALEGGKAAEAIQEYTSAISQNSQAVDYYIQRSIAYRRLKPANLNLALADAETSVVLAQQRARRELIAKAQLERGAVLYSLERFADAGQCFEWSEKYNPQEKRLAIWKMKVDEKLKALPAEEAKTAVSLPETPNIDLKADEKAAKPASTASLATVAASPTLSTSTSATTPAGPAFTPADKIRHDWYQSTETITITLMAKGVPKDKAMVEIRPGSVSIAFPLPTGSDFDFSLDPLFAKIDPQQSTYKIMSTKVEFVLKKSVPGQKWHSLEGTESIDEVEPSSVSHAPVAAPSSAAPSYPTSSRSGPKNWDKVVDDITKKKEEKDEEGGVEGGNDYDDEGGDAVNSFFQKLYKNADPDTRRAMMKSYQESNGTALSTNWSEVSTKTFDTTPPDGMEARKWGE